MRKRHPIHLILVALLLLSLVLPVAADGVATYVAVNNDAPAGKSFFLDDCDDSDGWFSSHGTTWSDPTEGTEGGASVAASATVAAYANQTVTIQSRFDTVDLSAIDVLSFDFCISDVALIDASYQFTVALVSGGTNSAAALTWQAAMMTQTYTANEWVHIELPLSQAISEGANLSEINVLRFKFRRTSPQQDLQDVVIRVDNVRVESFPTKAVMLLDCDDTTLWNAGAGYNTENHTQGFGCVSFRATTPAVEGGNSNMVYQAVFPAVDARNADYLEMDIYVSDANAVKNGTSSYGLHIEISSSGRCDAEEYEFDPDDYAETLHDGWNHIRLPLPSGRISNGACDVRRVNFFRIHLLNLHTAKNNELIVMLDNIYLSVVQDGVDDYPEEVTPPDAGGDTPVDSDTDAPVDGEDSSTEQEETPSVDNPDPYAPTNPEQVDGAEQAALRKRLTAQRARIIVLIFVFAIVGTDIVVVALRRKNDAELQVEAAGAMDEALDASEPVREDGEPGEDQTPEA